MTPEGNFTLNATNVTIDSNRHLISGSGSISDTSNNFTVDTVAMTVAQGGATASFTVTFDDQSVHHYTLNLTSGELTQDD
jgi:type VI protein secretion system component Hcp